MLVFLGRWDRRSLFLLLLSTANTSGLSERWWLGAWGCREQHVVSSLDLLHNWSWRSRQSRNAGQSRNTGAPKESLLPVGETGAWGPDLLDHSWKYSDRSRDTMAELSCGLEGRVETSSGNHPV